MIIEKKHYSYQDLTIVPEVISTINSRSECNPFVDGNLPIFASPMSTITNEKNISIWKQNHIMPIVPRNIDLIIRTSFMQDGEWVALSLNEFKDYFVNSTAQGKKDKTYRICVDLANGHMQSLYETINKAKELSRANGYNLIIMTGNIANPETYKWICRNAEVDYIRLSIGTGNNCITSTQTSIHYPIASLIDECYKIKSSIYPTLNSERDFTGIDTPYHSEIDVTDNFNCIKYKSKPYIVADGGVRGYADVSKALGLGADYVMIGSLFTGLFESAAPLNIECYNSHYKYTFDNKDGLIHNGIEWSTWGIWRDSFETDFENKKRNFIHDMKEITKESYGMSTKKAQKLINPNAKTKTSEGCTKYIKVKETVKQWTDNMISYLRSAMSYTDKKTIEEFKGKVNLIVNSNCAILAVNK